MLLFSINHFPHHPKLINRTSTPPPPHTIYHPTTTPIKILGLQWPTTSNACLHLQSSIMIFFNPKFRYFLYILFMCSRDEKMWESSKKKYNLHAFLGMQLNIWKIFYIQKIFYVNPTTSNMNNFLENTMEYQ